MASIAINPANTWIPKKSTNMDLSDYVTKDQLTNIYTYKGSVSNYENLPTENLISGDVWNVENDYTSVIDNKYYPAGTNWVWNGSEWDALGGFNNQANSLIEITYSELKSLRDNSQLTPGSFYRITDYVTTTTQSETKSANHPFDIVVLALSENTLCEDAKAMLHEGDEYFARCDLSAWKLMYCLDNDKTRFEWADEANGKGVIFRMIDEKQNDCPYDFKNILIKNEKYTDAVVTRDKYYYTFSYVQFNVQAAILYDGSVAARAVYCYGNSMKEWKSGGKVKVNLNVFKNTSFDNSCHSNTFGNFCHSNTFGNFCYSNTFGNFCYSNTFGNSCSSNTFDNSCYYNTFGNSCSSNTFGNSCSSNTFGNSCPSNTFGNSCHSNTFGNSCHSNTFGNFCYSNTFDNSCYYNRISDNTRNRKIEGGSEKTVISLSEEFYDDGSGQVVPVKHPDLSTQPSILPYKFMGRYVYEQLIPLAYTKAQGSTVEFDINFNKYGIEMNRLVLLKTSVIGEYDNPHTGTNSYLSLPITHCHFFSDNLIRFSISTSEDAEMELTDKTFLHIVYTSMPEDSSYYGYNEYQL